MEYLSSPTTAAVDTGGGSTFTPSFSFNQTGGYTADNEPTQRDLVLTVCPMKSGGSPPPPIFGHKSCILGPYFYTLGGVTNRSFASSPLLHRCSVTSLVWNAIETQGPHKPHGLFGHSATLIDDCLYVFGGITGDKSLSATAPRGAQETGQIVDEGLGQALTEAMEQGETQQSATLDTHNESKTTASQPIRTSLYGVKTSQPTRTALWIALGSSKPTNGLLRLSLTHTLWTPLMGRGVPPAARYCHSAVYVPCSYSSVPLPKDSEDVLYEEKQEHSTGPKYSKKRRFLVIFGGCSAAKYESAVSDLFLFDLDHRCWINPTFEKAGTDNQWSEGPSARFGASMCCVDDGVLLLFGGIHESKQSIQHFNDVWVCNLKHYPLRWTRPIIHGFPAMPRGLAVMSPLWNHSSVNSNASLMIGGVKSNKPAPKGTPPSGPSPDTQAQTEGKKKKRILSVANFGYTLEFPLDKARFPTYLYIFGGETGNPRGGGHCAISDLCVLDLTNRYCDKRDVIYAAKHSGDAKDKRTRHSYAWRWKRPLFDGHFEYMMHSGASLTLNQSLLCFGGLSENENGALDDFFFLNTVAIGGNAAVTPSNDFTFKLVLVGDIAVGKTCLVTRFVEDRFSHTHINTVGVDFKSMTTLVGGKVVKLQIWDTAGQERFDSVSSYYYRGADGAIVVYDVTNRDSFLGVQRWVNAITNVVGDGNVFFLLVGNKCDLVSDQKDRQVTRAEGAALAKRVKCPFLEVSAKDTENVDVTFMILAKRLVHARNKRLQAESGLRQQHTQRHGTAELTSDSASMHDKTIRMGDNSSLPAANSGGCC